MLLFRQPDGNDETNAELSSFAGLSVARFVASSPIARSHAHSTRLALQIPSRCRACYELSRQCHDGGGKPTHDCIRTDSTTRLSQKKRRRSKSTRRRLENPSGTTRATIRYGKPGRSIQSAVVVARARMDRASMEPIVGPLSREITATDNNNNSNNDKLINETIDCVTNHVAGCRQRARSSFFHGGIARIAPNLDSQRFLGHHSAQRREFSEYPQSPFGHGGGSVAKRGSLLVAVGRRDAQQPIVARTHGPFPHGPRNRVFGGGLRMPKGPANGIQQPQQQHHILFFYSKTGERLFVAAPSPAPPQFWIAIKEPHPARIPVHGQSESPVAQQPKLGGTHSGGKHRLFSQSSQNIVLVTVNQGSDPQVCLAQSPLGTGSNRETATRSCWRISQGAHQSRRAAIPLGWIGGRCLYRRPVGIYQGLGSATVSDHFCVPLPQH